MSLALPLLPSRRLAAAIALAGAGFLVSLQFALVLNLGLVLLVAADAVALYRRPLPRIRRSAPGRLALGGEGEVQVEADAGGTPPPSPRRGDSRTVVWTDDPGPGLHRVGPDPLEMVIPAGSPVETSYRIEGRERGHTFLGDVHLRVLGPLGLLWRRHREADRVPVSVQPGLRELHRHRTLALHHRRELGSHRLRELGEGREFARLREYVRGDDPRRIDWKATARHGEIIVREYEAERSQSLVLALDAGRLMGERFGDRERLDHALAAALVLADAAAVHGDSVGVLLFADTIQAFLPPGRHPLSRIADVLASVQSRRVEPDYPGAFRYLGRQLRRRSLVVLFSDVVDARASRALLAHLSASARHHLPLLVALRNVELEAAAVAPVSREEDVYHRAAAQELLQEREVALAAVRRQGVLVADVRPGAAVTETMARYVEVKRRGLL